MDLHAGGTTYTIEREVNEVNRNHHFVLKLTKILIVQQFFFVLLGNYRIAIYFQHTVLLRWNGIRWKLGIRNLRRRTQTLR